MAAWSQEANHAATQPTRENGAAPVDASGGETPPADEGDRALEPEPGQDPARGRCLPRGEHCERACLGQALPCGSGDRPRDPTGAGGGGGGEGGGRRREAPPPPLPPPPPPALPPRCAGGGRWAGAPRAGGAVRARGPAAPAPVGSRGR